MRPASKRSKRNDNADAYHTIEMTMRTILQKWRSRCTRTHICIYPHVAMNSRGGMCNTFVSWEMSKTIFSVVAIWNDKGSIRLSEGQLEMISNKFVVFEFSRLRNVWCDNYPDKHHGVRLECVVLDWLKFGGREINYFDCLALQQIIAEKSQVSRLHTTRKSSSNVAS